MKLNFSRISNLLSIVNFLILIIVPTFGFSVLKPFISQKYNEKYVGLDDKEKFSGSKSDSEWAKKIMNGGYILHFRHAERDKWIDVQMYDSLESDVKNSKSLRKAEDDYFTKAVCLNSRGLVQAKAIGEHLNNVELPIGYVISSPSCRSRQTADLAFGGYQTTNRDLVHIGPYVEDRKYRINNLKKIYSSLPIEKGKNTIVSAHNGVIINEMFINPEKAGKSPWLEEGGFYVISKTDKGLKLEHQFTYFKNFIKNFYSR